MTDSVRSVTDGEEILLAAGEPYRIGTPAVPVRTAVPGRVAIQYLGFHDADGHREYALRAQRGDEFRRCTMSIALAAFAERRALLQDGPDICYQKLMRLLAEVDLPGPDTIAVTDGELATYRAAHTPAARRGFSTPAPATEKASDPSADGS